MYMDYIRVLERRNLENFEDMNKKLFSAIPHYIDAIFG